jgi:hypothetical protein
MEQCGAREQKVLFILILPARLLIRSFTLIAKSTWYGVNKMLVKWIEFFPVAPSQFVRIGSSASNTCPELSGVLQGGKFNSILFIIIYVNDIP